MTTKKSLRKPIKPLPFDRQTLVRVRTDSVSQRLPGWHPIDWTGQNWAGARAEGGYFVDAILRRADLSGAWLSGANLTNANLSRCIMRGTELWGANFAGANLLRANISGAIFSDRYEGVAVGLTQAQIDLAIADPDDPPILDGVLDAETGEPLVWRGGLDAESERE